MTAYLGIDPGLGGAIAMLRGDRHVVVWDMPTVQRGGRGELDMRALADLLREPARGSIEAVVEHVHAMPRDSKVGAFSFGHSFGGARGVLAALSIPYTLAAPNVWKKALSVPAGKDAARARASELLPGFACLWPLKKHDGRAEAALLALYARRVGRSIDGMLS